MDDSRTDSELVGKIERLDVDEEPKERREKRDYIPVSNC